VFAGRRKSFMSRFVIQFLKDVLGENGREKEICQCSVEIDAPSKIEATGVSEEKIL
jgi:hypothetical protein